MQDPHLYQVEPSQGTDSAIVFVTGFRTKKCYLSEHHKSWVHSLRASGWRGAIYHFWWDSGTSKLPLQEIENWQRHKRRARCAGEMYLEKMVVYKVKESSVTLVGHSLGARVIFFAMRSWYAQSSHKLKNVYLLGGAVPTGRDWKLAVSKVKGNIFNLYNSNDPVLNRAYKLAERGLNPCGAAPVALTHSNFDNINVTDFVGKTHDSSKYLKALSRRILLDV